MNLYARLIHLLTLGRRRRPRVDLWGEARTPFRVHLNDLDANGHMNNGRYLTLLDLARIDMMTRAGYLKQTVTAGWYGVVASQEITYRKSLKAFQKFEVVSRIHGHDGKNVLIAQDFVVGDVVHARAIVGARFLKRSGGSVSIAEFLELVGEAPEWFTNPESAEMAAAS